MQMNYFSIFDTDANSQKEIRRRHILLIVNAIVLSWLVWCIVNAQHYRQIHGMRLLRDILTDLLEHLIEIVVLVELSIVYSKLIIRIHWKRERTIVRLFAQVIILTVMNVMTAIAIGVIYQVIYPEDPTILLRVFITDFAVVSTLSTTYFVSFLVSRHHRAEKIALRTKLDNLSLQTNNHFMFNCFGTLSNLIQTKPNDAEQFLQSLSQMYRYLMQNGDRRLIPLKEELRFTDNYISLVNYRYKGITVRIDDSLRRTNAYVFPVSVQQLVENAVKHNSHGAKVTLQVDVKKQGDALVVENNIVPLKYDGLKSSKTGIENLRKRVNLISGKDIDVQDDGSFFRVQIPLIYEEDLRDESLDN